MSGAASKWRHSVAFKLFLVSVTVIMLLLGGVMAVLAGSFASFYERRQMIDITDELNRLRDRYVRESRPDAQPTIPPYFFEFEKQYYALTSIMTLDDNRMLILVGGGIGNRPVVAESGRLPLLPDRLPALPNGAALQDALRDRVSYFIAKPALDEQRDKLMLAIMEWRSNADATERVLVQGETLVFRAAGAERAGADALRSGDNQLIAAARIDGDGEGNGRVLFVVSSLQPISSAAGVIRDFSYYVFGAALVFGLLLASLYARIVTRPLRKLNLLARKLAKLDFKVRSGTDRKDEIGELGRTFDFLADNLQRTLTELHAANDRLKADIEREKQLERMRRDFVAGVSHELKTPLSMIGGYAEGLRDNIGSGAKRERYAQVILDETRHMSAIVADMLDLSHLESGQYKLHLAAFDLLPLLRESADRAEILAEGKNVRIAVDAPPGAATEGLAVRGDRTRIGQVLTNLLSNAVRHTPEGGTIELKVRLLNKAAEIAVRNEGEPIPAEELPRIWGQFYRADKSRSRESGGTGIGLAIVRQILELHGSRYEVRNEADGVTFAFTLGR